MPYYPPSGGGGGSPENPSLYLNALYSEAGTIRLNEGYTGRLTGTAYTVTNTASAVTGGTTSPTVTLDESGTYELSAGFQIGYAAATVVAETATLKIRRTNNTSGDIASLVYDLPASTTLTQTMGFPCLSFKYTSVADGDILSLFANVSATLGAGAISCEAGGTFLTAVRLYE